MSQEAAMKCAQAIAMGAAMKRAQAIAMGAAMMRALVHRGRGALSQRRALDFQHSG
jgi:hypothetical protein